MPTSRKRAVDIPDEASQGASRSNPKYRTHILLNSCSEANITRRQDSTTTLLPAVERNIVPVSYIKWSRSCIRTNSGL